MKEGDKARLLFFLSFFLSLCLCAFVFHTLL